MTDDLNDDNKEQTRQLAREVSAYLSEAQKQILGEHSAMARWLTASLLAVNGAGALAVFNATESCSIQCSAELRSFLASSQLCFLPY